MARPTMKDDIVVNKPSAVLQQYLPPSPKSILKASSTSANNNSDTRPKEKTPTRKQVLLQQNIERRRQYESMVSEWQDKLLDPVTEQVLGEAANRLKQSHYKEIIEERNIEKLCGYPLCPNPPRDIKGKFRISLNERKVYDITPLKQFCSSKCLVASRWFESQLTEEPLYLVNKDPEQLREITVSIVPLNMDLEEFQRTRGRHIPTVGTGAGIEEAIPRQADAFTIESPDRLAKVVPTLFKGDDRSEEAEAASKPAVAQEQQQQTSSFPISPLMPSLSSNASNYIQSILATVPSTPSTIRIVERESSLLPSSAASRTTTMAVSHQGDIDQAMRDAYGTPSSTRQHRDGGQRGGENSRERDEEQAYEIVEGFRVPIGQSRQQKPSTMLLNHRKNHTATPFPAEGREGQQQRVSATAAGKATERQHVTSSVAAIEKSMSSIKISERPLDG